MPPRQDLDLPHNLLVHFWRLDFLAVQNLHSHFVPSDLMLGQLDLPEGPLKEQPEYWLEGWPGRVFCTPGNFEINQQGKRKLRNNSHWFGFGKTYDIITKQKTNYVRFFLKNILPVSWLPRGKPRQGRSVLNKELKPELMKEILKFAFNLLCHCLVYLNAQYCFMWANLVCLLSSIKMANISSACLVVINEILHHSTIERASQRKR